MLKVITGEPRSGKTLFAVREIILKNYVWDSTFLEWRVKTDVPPFVLFTNIDGLRLPHINIDDYFAKIENTLSEKSGRVEEILGKKPTPTPVSKDKEARIKILVDRAMADPRVDKKASRAQVEATIRARPEFK